MDSNLLKEAIADAKAVRQTALANAKAALEEVFGRRFEAMFAPKLEEDSVDVAPESPVGSAATAAPTMEQEAAVNETDIDEIIRELEAEVGAEDGAAPFPGAAPEAPMAPPVDAGAPGALPGAAPMAPPMAPPVAPAVPPVAPPPMAPPMAPDAAGGMEAPPAAPAAPGEEEDMDEEIDINELLESLKEENEEEDEDEEKGNKPPWLKESVPAKSSGIGTSDNKTSSEFVSSKIGKGGDVENGVPEGKVTAKEPTQASRPNQAKNATKTNLSTPGGALKENTGGSTPGYPEGAKKTSTGDDPSEADRPNQADHATKDDLSTVPSPLKEENDALKHQLGEAEDTVRYLKKELNEINLLNAKLLYTNKLFKEFTMPNDKKMKVVEMFDLAKNVREVKMTYAVIAESLNFGAEPKKKISKVQTITEGMASKAVAGTKPGKQIIAESASSDMVSKFQKLAGIKAPSTNKQ